MRTRSLLIIGAAAVLALLAAAWVSSSRTPDPASAQPAPLAPGLSEALDAVTRVRIIAAGDTVLATLERDEGGWRLAEKGGYRVDVEKLRDLLSSIAAARRVEAKTALPERHVQLGVEDVAADDAHGVRVDITTPQKTWSYIVGDNLARGSGTYVRATDEAQSWLIGSNLAVERSPANWLVKRIIDVGANRIASIAVAPETSAGFRLVRSDGDPASDFVFATLPRGRKAAEGGYQREALAGVLSGLMFEDVFPDADMPAPETTRSTQFLLDDGRRVTVRSWQQEGRTFATFAMTLDEDAAAAWIARQPVPEAGDDADAAPVVTLDALAAEVAGFQETHGDWVYALPTFKASNLNKELEDYLEPEK